MRNKIHTGDKTDVCEVKGRHWKQSWRKTGQRRRPSKGEYGEAEWYRENISSEIAARDFQMTNGNCGTFPLQVNLANTSEYSELPCKQILNRDLERTQSDEKLKDDEGTREWVFTMKAALYLRYFLFSYGLCTKPHFCSSSLPAPHIYVLSLTRTQGNPFLLASLLFLWSTQNLKWTKASGFKAF